MRKCEGHYPEENIWTETRKKIRRINSRRTQKEVKVQKGRVKKLGTVFNRDENGEIWRAR